MDVATIKHAQKRAEELGCTVKNGKWIGPGKQGLVKAPFVSVGKALPPGVGHPQKLDQEGRPAVAVFQKKQEPYIKGFGWVMVPAPAPSGAKRTRKPKEDGESRAS
jgi:hypothetical protein